MAKITHDNDKEKWKINWIIKKEIGEEEISDPIDYILWDDCQILIREMFGETLLVEEKSNS